MVLLDLEGWDNMVFFSFHIFVLLACIIYMVLVQRILVELLRLYRIMASWVNIFQCNISGFVITNIHITYFISWHDLSLRLFQSYYFDDDYIGLYYSIAISRVVYSIKFDLFELAEFEIFKIELYSIQIRIGFFDSDKLIRIELNRIKSESISIVF